MLDVYADVTEDVDAGIMAVDVVLTADVETTADVAATAAVDVEITADVAAAATVAAAITIAGIPVPECAEEHTVKVSATVTGQATMMHPATGASAWQMVLIMAAVAAIINTAQRGDGEFRSFFSL